MSTAQIVDVVLIWTWHSPQSTFMGIRWSNFSPQGEGETTPSRLAPFYFSRDYVRHGFLSNKRYPQGGRGVVLRVHKLLGRPTHVDLRLPDGKFLLEVPVDYLRTLD